MKIITIDREYGAGGHTVGKAVADKLGIEIYDRDIIRGAVKSSGVSFDEVEHEEEALSRGDSFISHIVPMSFELKDVIFDAEREAILGLAEGGPCVMLGRCASAILADEGIETLSVFLHASKRLRVPVVAELEGTENEADVLKAIKKRDDARRAYYEHYTDREWGDYRNYDLMLDVGTLGYDQCIDIIVAAASAE